MSDFIHLDGKRIVSGSINIPFWGTWSGDVVLALPDAISHQPVLTFGGLSLQASVFRASSFAGSRSVRLLGGAGGWRKPVAQKPYNQPGGIQLSLILNDLAQEVGETVRIAQDGPVGSFFVRQAAKAQFVLRQLAGPLWWIDPAGVTQIGPRPNLPIKSQFDVLDSSGARGEFRIATETYQDWLPGNTFTAPTVTGVQTISMVTIVFDHEGKSHLEVLAS
jgi:hypothetical protein